MKTHKQQNNTINTLINKIKEIHCSFKKLESEIIVVKKINARRECAEFVGTPSSVERDQRELTFCRILHHIGVNISGKKIQACHLLGKNSDRTIIKFSNRKDCKHTKRFKKDLKDLDATSLIRRR